MVSNKKGQSVLEYGLLISAVVVALLFINLYLTRSIQGKVKESSDEISKQQFNATTYNTTWKAASGTAATSTVETRTTANGTMTSVIGTGEIVTRNETDDWGTTVPALPQ